MKKESEHPITPAQSRAINRFDVAIRNHEMKGSMRPETWDAVDYEYEAAKVAIKFQFRKLNK